MIQAVGWRDAWGYHKNSHFDGYYDEEEQHLIRGLMQAKNILNVFGYPLSPIVGIVRIIAASWLLFKARNEKEETPNGEVKKMRQFLCMEIARGCLELLCLGIFLAIVDGIVSWIRYRHVPGLIT